MKRLKNTIVLKDYYENVDAIIFTNESPEIIKQAIIKAKNDYDDNGYTDGQLHYVLDCLTEQFEMDYIDYNIDEIYY